MNGTFENIKHDLGKVCLLVDFSYCLNEMPYRSKEKKGFICVYPIGYIQSFIAGGIVDEQFKQETAGHKWDPEAEILFRKQRILSRMKVRQ